MSNISGSYSALNPNVLKFDLQTIDMAFTPNGGTAIADGTVVALNTSGNLVAAGATAYPIGTVISYDKTNLKNVVRTPFYEHRRVVATGGALQSGAMVALVGTYNAAGLANVAAAVTTNYVYGVVLVGGAENSVIEVGTVNPYKI
jgi:hypothetical protein